MIDVWRSILECLFIADEKQIHLTWGKWRIYRKYSFLLKAVGKRVIKSKVESWFWDYRQVFSWTTLYLVYPPYIVTTDGQYI